MTKATYSAFYQHDHGRIIFRFKEDDGTLDTLPQQATPADDPRSTFFRTDGGDRFQFALFRTNQGQLIVVQRDSNSRGRSTPQPHHVKRGIGTNGEPPNPVTQC